MEIDIISISIFIHCITQRWAGDLSKLYLWPRKLTSKSKPQWLILRSIPSSNRAICCKLQNICFSLLIDLDTLDTLIIMSPKIDASYLMDTTVRLGPLKFSLQATIDHHGPSIHSGHYTASINCWKKTFYCHDHTITEFGIIDKTPLLHMLYYMNGLTHDFWTRTGGWEFDRPHGAGTSSPSHWQQVEEQAPKPVG